MMAFNGRDDGLFRAGIMASGRFFADAMEMMAAQSKYDSLVSQTGCQGGNVAGSSLECLRALPFEKLNAAVNSRTGLLTWGPMVDSDMIARNSHQQFLDGAYLRVLIIAGENTAEGTAFAPKGIDTTEQFRDFLLSSPSSLMSKAYAQVLLDAYPERSADDCLPSLPRDYAPPAYPYGTQFRRVATYMGDSMISNRRTTCAAWAAALNGNNNSNLSTAPAAYCYRFNAVPAWAEPLDGATHFAEVAFAMLNPEGVGYAPDRTPSDAAVCGARRGVPGPRAAHGRRLDRVRQQQQPEPVGRPRGRGATMERRRQEGGARVARLRPSGGGWAAAAELCVRCEHHQLG